MSADFLIKIRVIDKNQPPFTAQSTVVSIRVHSRTKKLKIRVICGQKFMCCCTPETAREALIYSIENKSRLL
ncbi:MAG: hypothetical protein LBT00_09955 [Spirochaetaceae bacterium]|nr:hypothetical protein [Spirochaetaceae bacterium]